MNQLIDTHAHLTWNLFENDFYEVLDRAYKTGVKTIINVGPDLERSQQVIDLNYSPLKSYATIGAHPHEAIKLGNDDALSEYINRLEEIYKSNPEKVIAIGECGLDYFRLLEESRSSSEARVSYHFKGTDYSPSEIPEEEQKQIQKKLFIAQIILAKKLNLPLIIHCRDSFDDIFKTTQSSQALLIPELQGTSGVFHSFTGNKEQAKKVLDLGYFLGFTCIITYPKNEHLREIIKETPIDKILTETDCPFLPPQTRRGQRSEPADVVEVVKVIAQMKELSFEKAAEATFENAVKLFKLAEK